MALGESFFYFSLFCCLTFGRASHGTRRKLMPDYDCNLGCSSASIRLTCAEGITFQNDCLPYCQGLDNIIEGPCTDGGILSNLFNQKMVAEGIGRDSSSVSDDILLEYEKEDFLYVGSVDLSDAKPTPKQTLSGSNFEAASLPPDVVTAIRITAEGNLYASKYKMSDLRSLNEGFVSQATAFEKESVIGKDTRTRVTDTTKFPFSSICEIDYAGEQGGCTGAIIGQTSVLSAAHCVFDGKKFYQVSKVAPGRQRLSNGQIVPQLPQAEFAFKDATIFESYMKGEDIKFDVAVIRVANTGLGSIGSVFKPLPIQSLTGACSIDPSSRVTGYPVDLVKGAMYTSGFCEEWKYRCNEMRLSHNCDTFGGNSGSPMYNSEKIIFGVHTHGGSEFNSGVALTDFHVKNIIEWADIKPPVDDDNNDHNDQDDNDQDDKHQILKDRRQKRRQRRQNRKARTGNGGGNGGNDDGSGNRRANNDNTGNRRNGDGNGNGNTGNRRNNNGNTGNTGNRRNNNGNTGNSGNRRNNSGSNGNRRNNNGNR